MTPRWRCYDIFSGFWTISLPRDLLTFSPSLSTHCYPSSHPSMWAFFLGFLSVRKLQYSLQSLSLSLILSVTCRPGKLLALILYLSAVATVSGFPAPTNSFISDLQRKTWETLSHAHTHDWTPAHKIHAKVHHSRTTLPDIVPHTHNTNSHSHSQVYVCCFYFWHKQVQLSQVRKCMQTYMYVILSEHPNMCASVRHMHSHRLYARRKK